MKQDIKQKKPAHLVTRSDIFTSLAEQALYGVCLTMQPQVIATHKEFVILRRCAQFMSGNPEQHIHILSPGNVARTRYLVNTLMHLGVSCGKINVILGEHDLDTPDGVWMFITEGKQELAA